VDCLRNGADMGMCANGRILTTQHIETKAAAARLQQLSRMEYSVYMNVEFAAASPPPGKSAAGGKNKRRGARPERLRLLIVEDEIFVAMNMEAMVQAAGHEVVDIVISAQAAIDGAETLQPDLVLMDINLSGPRDGIDAALEIRQRFGIDSLFVTAFEDQATQARAAAAKPAGYVTKPFTRHELIASIETWRDD